MKYLIIICQKYYGYVIDGKPNIICDTLDEAKQAKEYLEKQNGEVFDIVEINDFSEIKTIEIISQIWALRNKIEDAEADAIADFVKIGKNKNYHILKIGSKEFSDIISVIDNATYNEGKLEVLAPFVNNGEPIGGLNAQEAFDLIKLHYGFLFLNLEAQDENIKR